MSKKIKVAEYKSPVGLLLLGSYENQFVLADWKYRKMRKAIDQRIQSFFQAEYEEADSEIIQSAITQFEEYFIKKRKHFDLNLGFAGTKFQQKVWEELLKIPFGKNTSYLQLSQGLGDEKAIRAVASANGANAISIIVPCHRVIGSNGDLVGYAGGLSAKKKLLALESGFKQEELF